MDHVRPQSIVDQPWTAALSWPRGGRGRGECGGPVLGLTDGRVAAKQSGDGGEGGSGKTSSAESLEAQN
jgi:hypothetical protein